MNNITNVVVEFLTTEEDCILVSNEVSLNDVLKIRKENNIKVVNEENKRFVHSNTLQEKIHRIEPYLLK